MVKKASECCLIDGVLADLVDCSISILDYNVLAIYV
jgi:hypothetical protein